MLFGFMQNRLHAAKNEFTGKWCQMGMRPRRNGIAAEGRRRPGREAFVCDSRIARSVWSAPALAALSCGQRGRNGGCSPCGQKRC
jgi:hypothetical protein